MSNALETQGFKFEIGNGNSPLTYTEVKEVVSFNGFDGKASEIDITHLQSTAKEFLMGLRDFANFNLEVNYLSGDTGQDAMRAAQASRDIQDFKITFSDSNNATFQGYVMSNPV